MLRFFYLFLSWLFCILIVSFFNNWLLFKSECHVDSWQSEYFISSHLFNWCVFNPGRSRSQPSLTDGQMVCSNTTLLLQIIVIICKDGVGEAFFPVWTFEPGPSDDSLGLWPLLHCDPTQQRNSNIDLFYQHWINIFYP